MKAKKCLGQHFLKDDAISQQIVDAFNQRQPYPATLLEIGPGRGALTQFLVNKEFPHLYLIEVDHELVAYLSRTYPPLAHHIIEADFLELDLSQKWPGTIGVIGNFPYNISSPIFFKLLQHRDQVQEIVCMVQKEVADRIAAKPGSKIYGIPSVLLQAFYQVEYLFTVEPSVFTPPPEVHSAVIRLRRNNIQQLACDEGLFFKLVKLGFQQRRKKLKNALSNLGSSMQHMDMPFLNQRAEELSVQDFVQLTEQITKGVCSISIPLF
jgi:16S rRNA (adenine1518-N6/adenine1519-N6)-dimethyltransferase